MTDRIDHSHPTELDEILARIDALVSPASIEQTHAQERVRLELFRERIEHALIDLDLSPECGITTVLFGSTLAIEAKSRRSVEILLRVLEHHADHHLWGSTGW